MVHHLLHGRHVIVYVYCTSVWLYMHYHTAHGIQGICYMVYCMYTGHCTAVLYYTSIGALYSGHDAVHTLVHARVCIHTQVVRTTCSAQHTMCVTPSTGASIYTISTAICHHLDIPLLITCWQGISVHGHFTPNSLGIACMYLASMWLVGHMPSGVVVAVGGAK